MAIRPSVVFVCVLFLQWCGGFLNLEDFDDVDIELSDFTEFERNFIFGNETKGKKVGTVRLIGEEWETDDISTPQLILTLETDQQQIIKIALEIKSHLLAPNFKLIVRGSEGIEQHSYHDSPSCIFTGAVISPQRGEAALSRCGRGNKLRGVIVTPTNHYLLHPAPKKLREKRDTNFKDDSATDNLHLVTTPDMSHGTCGVEDKESDHDRYYQDFDLFHMLETDIKLENFNNELNNNTTQSTTAVPPTQKPETNEYVSKHTFTLKTVETAVFVDDIMYTKIANEYPDEDTVDKITHIVFTFVNMVELIYNQPSLSIPLRIVLLRLEIYKPDAKEKPDNKDGHSRNFLSSFCEWQWKLNPGFHKDDPDHWDHALMITGVNIYTDFKNNSGVIGIAWLHGMCDPLYSCSLNEGVTFGTVYVISHEMGHNLGVHHDGHNNPCDDKKNIMSPTVGPGKISWSWCSRQQMEDFLTNPGNSQQVSCLEDHVYPEERIIDHKMIGLPGDYYSASDQCMYVLGRNHTAHYRNASKLFENICNILYCRLGKLAHPIHPALEGTPCSPDKPPKICIRGKCVTDDRKSSERHENNGTLIPYVKAKNTTANAMTTMKPATVIKETNATVLKLVKSGDSDDDDLIIIGDEDNNIDEEQNIFHKILQNYVDQIKDRFDALFGSS